MSNLNPDLREALARLVPTYEHRSGDWPAVLRDAEPPRRRITGSWRLAPVAVAVAALAAALTLTWPSGHASVVDRARAAIGDGAVIHLVEPEDFSHYALVEIATGKTTRSRKGEFEVWYDPARSILHQLQRQDGKVIVDSLLTPQGTWSNAFPEVLAPSPRRFLKLSESLTGFVTRYREALESGDATLAGEGRVDGHDVYWIRFRERTEPKDPLGYMKGVDRIVEEAAVDTETYKPVLVRTIVNGDVQSERKVTLIEAVDYDPADFQRPELEPFPTGGDVLSTTQVAQGDAAALLDGKALWAGPNVGGLAFEHAYRQELKTTFARSSGIAPRFSTGLLLAYGAVEKPEYGASFDQRTNEPWLIIAESLHREGNYMWWSLPGWDDPPAGYARDLGSPPVLTLRHGDVFVTIRGSTRALALAAARALTPLR